MKLLSVKEFADLCGVTAPSINVRIGYTVFIVKQNPQIIDADDERNKKVIEYYKIRNHSQKN